MSKALIFGDVDDPKSEIFNILATVPTSVIKSELGTKPKVFYIQADHSLKGRIQFSEDFKEAIIDYRKSIPSPDASYWGKQDQK